jgi:hypothetical protein
LFGAESRLVMRRRQLDNAMLMTSDYTRIDAYRWRNHDLIKVGANTDMQIE